MNKYKDYYNRIQSMILAGLIAFALIIIQAIISIGKFKDITLLIAVIAFATAIPTLVFNFLLNELFSVSKNLEITNGYRFIWITSLLSSIVGIVAVFWYMNKFAALAIVISGVIGLIVFINNDVRVKNQLIKEDQTDDQSNATHLQQPDTL